MLPIGLFSSSRRGTPKPVIFGQLSRKFFVLNETLRWSWLWASLLLFFSVHPLRAHPVIAPPEGSNIKQVCPLAPALVDFWRVCQLGEYPDDECAWLPVLEQIVEGNEARAIELLSDSFALPTENAVRLQEAVHLWLLFLLGDFCNDSVALRELIFSGLSLGLGSLKQAEGLLLTCELLGVDPQALTVFSMNLTSSLWDSLRKATASFSRLARRTGLLDESLEQLNQISSWVDNGILPNFTSWPSELEDLAKTMEQIDAALLGLSGETLHSFHREAENIIRRRLSLEEQGQLWVRTGFGLMMRGLVEDAAIALMKADRCFLESPSLGPVSRFVRIYSGQKLSLLFGAMGWHREVESIQQSLVAMAESPMERWLVRHLPIFSANLANAITDTSSVFAGEKLQEIIKYIFLGNPNPRETEALLQSALIVVPWMASTKPKPVSYSTSVPQPHLGDLVETLLTGELEESLEGWLGMSKGSRQYEQAYWPIMIAMSASLQGRLDLARTAFEEAIFRLEKGLVSMGFDDMARGWVDQISAPLYPLAVSLSFSAKKPEEAFAYAERGRAFTPSAPWCWAIR